MIYVTTLYGQIIKKERVHMKEQQTGTIKIPLQERYMISLKEASAYFHIGIKKMRRMDMFCTSEHTECVVWIQRKHI